jgi:glycosyltransferase involved in cell wall biosynthesis
MMTPPVNGQESKRAPVNIAVVSPFLLGGESTHGGQVGALGLLKNLAQSYRLHVIAMDEGKSFEETSRAVKGMEEWAASVKLVHFQMTILKRLRAKLLAFLFVPNNVVRHRSSEFRQACQDTLAKYHIDLAIVQFPQMAQYVEEFKGVPTVMDVQDAQSVSQFRDIAASDSLLAKCLALRNWLSWVRYERHYYGMFGHLFTVSEQDSYGLTLFNPAAKTTVLPRCIPLPANCCLSGEPEFHIGFMGSFFHKPNLLAVHFLFEKVIPGLLMQVPDLRVLIAGKNPPKELTDRAPGCVKFAGFVPAVEDFYRQISIVVAPLITGGGIKIKVVEGLLSGLPVVTTNVGAEGIDLTDGVNALIAETPDEFVAATVKLIDHRTYRAAVGAAGRKYAASLTSNERHSELVGNVIKSLCEVS